MRTCKDVIDLLSDYIDGGLPPDEKDEFETHLKTCTACVEFLSSVRATRSQVKDLQCEDLPTDVHRALRSFLDKAAKRRSS
jgi:anti-sigma factor RsiW